MTDTCCSTSTVSLSPSDDFLQAIGMTTTFRLMIYFAEPGADGPSMAIASGRVPVPLTSKLPIYRRMHSSRHGRALAWRFHRRVITNAVRVDAAGSAVVSHTGAVLLVETVRRLGPDQQLGRALARWRKPTAVHDPGVVCDLGPVSPARTIL